MAVRSLVVISWGILGCEEVVWGAVVAWEGSSSVSWALDWEGWSAAAAAVGECGEVADSFASPSRFAGGGRVAELGEASLVRFRRAMLISLRMRSSGV